MEEEDLFVFNDTIEGPRRQVTRGEPSFRCGSAPPCITIMSRVKCLEGAGQNEGGLRERWLIMTR